MRRGARPRRIFRARPRSCCSRFHALTPGSTCRHPSSPCSSAPHRRRSRSVARCWWLVALRRAARRGSTCGRDADQPADAATRLAESRNRRRRWAADRAGQCPGVPGARSVRLRPAQSSRPAHRRRPDQGRPDDHGRGRRPAAGLERRNDELRARTSPRATWRRARAWHSTVEARRRWPSTGPLNRPSDGAERPIADALVFAYTGVFVRQPLAAVSPNGDGVDDVQRALLQGRTSLGRDVDAHVAGRRDPGHRRRSISRPACIRSRFHLRLAPLSPREAGS